MATSGLELSHVATLLQAPEHRPSSSDQGLSSEQGFSGGYEPQQPPSNGSGYMPSFPPGPHVPPPPLDLPSGHPFNPAAQSQSADGGAAQQGMHRLHQGDSVYHKASSSSAPQPAKIVGYFTRPGMLQRLYLEAGLATRIAHCILLYL